MKQLSRILLLAIATIALAWFLPWLYNYVFPQTSTPPFVQYSPVTDGWIVSEFSKGVADPDVFELDSEGRPSNHYTIEQRDSLLPQTFYSRLMSRGVMPDTIAGLEINMPTLRHNELMYSISPRSFVAETPDVWLIMESMPARFNFEDPKEAFRLTSDGRVEFITIATNSINADRSRRFTEAFARNGFQFPARSLDANITPRKSYDNGYLIVDASGDIFHLKQQAGRPYMTRIPMTDGETARYAFVLEPMSHEDLGLVVTDSGRIYRLKADYQLQAVPAVTLDISRQRLMLMSNYFNSVYRVASDTAVDWYAVDADGTTLLGRYHYDEPASTATTIAGWLMPTKLKLTSDFDSLARPRLVDFSAQALVLGALLALIIIVVYRRRRQGPAATATAALATLIFGLYIFIPLLLIRK